MLKKIWPWSVIDRLETALCEVEDTIAIGDLVRMSNGKKEA